MNQSRVASLLKDFALKRILVIGDLMLDEFLWGKVSRISPEAPVPVVEVVKEQFFPGGAANVARNLIGFTRGVDLLGVTGNCRHAATLRELLLAEGINIDGVQLHDEYQTTVKARVIARNQHVVRIDRERRLTLQPEHARIALERLAAVLPLVDGVIIEDYGKGLLDQQFASAVNQLVGAHGKILAIDPNPNNPLAWQSATVVKPNRQEAFLSADRADKAVGIHPTQDTALEEVGRILLEKWHCDNLLITLGEQGVMLFRTGQSPYHAPTRAREVFDVSGAGDTVISLFTLALAAGATAPEAAEIANHASGVVVGKLGTATLTPDELLASFGSTLN